MKEFIFREVLIARLILDIWNGVHIYAEEKFIKIFNILIKDLMISYTYSNIQLRI